MATVTTDQLLGEVREVCNRSPLVSHIDESVVDADVLALRAHLKITDAFISVFYNLATDKTAFALIVSGQRLYGVDNARKGWHKHPFEDPNQHEGCAPLRFADFVADVEAHYRARGELR